MMRAAPLFFLCLLALAATAAGRYNRRTYCGSGENKKRGWQRYLVISPDVEIMLSGLADLATQEYIALDGNNGTMVPCPDDYGTSVWDACTRAAADLGEYYIKIFFAVTCDSPPSANLTLDTLIFMPATSSNLPPQVVEVVEEVVE